MAIDRFLGIIAVSLNFSGLFFVLLGTFRFIRSEITMWPTATPYVGFSLDRLKTLSWQKSHTISGLILIAASLIVETLSLVFVLEPLEILTGHEQLALTFALCLGILLVIVVFRRSLLNCRRTEEKAKRAIMRDRLVRMFNRNPLLRAEWSSAVESAETLLGFKWSVGEPIEMFLRKIAQELKVKFPAGLQIEDAQAKPSTLISTRAAEAQT